MRRRRNIYICFIMMVFMISSLSACDKKTDSMGRYIEEELILPGRHGGEEYDVFGIFTNVNGQIEIFSTGITDGIYSGSFP